MTDKIPDSTRSLLIFPLSNGAQWPIDEASEKVHYIIADAIANKLASVVLTIDGRVTSIGMGLIAPDGERSVVIVVPYVKPPKIVEAVEMPPDLMRSNTNRR